MKSLPRTAIGVKVKLICFSKMLSSRSLSTRRGTREKRVGILYAPVILSVTKDIGVGHFSIGPPSADLSSLSPCIVSLTLISFKELSGGVSHVRRKSG
jgi:hypothetical protein